MKNIETVYMLLFTSIYSTTNCGLSLISILAFFQYWQHILNERAVIYNHKTHADDGLLITWSSDNINTCSGGADISSVETRGASLSKSSGKPYFSRSNNCSSQNSAKQYLQFLIFNLESTGIRLPKKLGQPN